MFSSASLELMGQGTRALTNFPEYLRVSSFGSLQWLISASGTSGYESISPDGIVPTSDGFLWVQGTTAALSNITWTGGHNFDISGAGSKYATYILKVDASSGRIVFKNFVKDNDDASAGYGVIGNGVVVDETNKRLYLIGSCKCLTPEIWSLN